MKQLILSVTWAIATAIPTLNAQEASRCDTPQQSANAARSQPAAAKTPVARTPRTKQGSRLPGIGNGDAQPRGNGDRAQEPVAQGGPNRQPGQNGNHNPN